MTEKSGVERMIHENKRHMGLQIVAVLIGIFLIIGILFLFGSVGPDDDDKNITETDNFSISGMEIPIIEKENSDDEIVVKPENNKDNPFNEEEFSPMEMTVMFYKAVETKDYDTFERIVSSAFLESEIKGRKLSGVEELWIFQRTIERVEVENCGGNAAYGSGNTGFCRVKVYYIDGDRDFTVNFRRKANGGWEVMTF